MLRMFMKRVTLPNNWIGISIMLLAIFLLLAVPAAVTLWLISLVAPWWVAVPCAVAAGLLAVLRFVHFEK